ncbi:MAG: geranylgeranyl reductase family protein [Promethearchaeota archaeon]
MLKPSVDVAIVGSGPAGCAAARVTAEYGLSTVIFDSRSKVGVPIQCGEYLPTPNEIRDLLPHSPRAPKLVSVNSDYVTNQCSHLRLFSPHGNGFEFALKANIINRTLFDQQLAHQAEEAGAKLHLQSTAIKRTSNNTLIINSKKTGRTNVRARIVIGADGAQSRIARSIGMVYTNKAQDYSKTVQFVMKNVDSDPDFTEMYFGSQIAPGGYAWIIPKGDSIANVGLGLRECFGANNVRALDYLQRFIRFHPIASAQLKNAKIIRRTGAILPVGGPLKKTYSDSVLLAGDAAGHVMASNGGGIPTALVGGDIAGHTAVKHLDEEVPLSWYEETWKKEIGSELFSALLILRIADQVMISDNLTNLCMRLAGIRYMRHLIRCRLPWPVNFASKSIVKIMKKLV